MIYLKLYELVLRNEIQQIIETRYKEDFTSAPLKLLLQHEYNSFDYSDRNNTVIAELKTLKTSTFSDYSIINLLTVKEYQTFKNALEHDNNTLCFVFLYFCTDNSFYLCKKTQDIELEKSVNMYDRACYNIPTSFFKPVKLYMDYRLFIYFNLSFNSIPQTV